MNKFFALFALLGMLYGLAVPAFAEESTVPATASTTTTVQTPTATNAVKPAEVAATHAAAPTPNKGDTAWMLTATLLVIMMSIPGLALFYGGLVRSKNMLSILMQVFAIFALIIVLWAIYGYSLAFTQGNAFIGGFDRLFLKGIFDPATGSVANVATFSKGVVIPEFAFVVFQATFAAIAVALIVGAFAERMKFSAVLLFSALWFTFAYLPIAHMVWFWMGPDAYTTQAAADTATAASGWLFQKGALDFAGGTVVHINAAVAGLVGAFMVGKRIGYGKEPMAPHNMVMTMIGGSLLWVGWFGFNAGSALEASGTATLAFVNTLVATAAAALTWTLAEQLLKGKPSVLGAVSGAVAGLVAITPACGWVGVGGGLIIGALAGVACFWGVTGLKKLLGADDALDVFGIHGIGGVLGALLTGVFNTWSMGGAGIVDYVNNTIVDTTISGQLWIQAQAVLTTIIWSGVVAFVCYKIVDMTIGLRVKQEEEREGLDTASHGERAYNF
ncbi:MAG: ammonium transporter [Candidatus Nitrotoga sp.]|nr:ammonium transporter [Candidatus Nitrotoga sp.]MDP1855288.1 ammonium transporter [Candidatus Nitrotoga sp.]